MRVLQPKRASTSAFVGLLLLISCAAALRAAGPTAIWLSQGLGGAQPFTYVGGKDLSMSSDGNFVVFTAASRDLTPDSDGAQQVYLRDMTTGNVQLLSKNAAGQAGDLPSYAPNISPSGRYVTFFTLAHNFLSGGNGQIVWLDRQTGQMQLASVSTSGERANRGVGNQSKVSSNGRYVVFRSWASNLVVGNSDSYTDVYLRDVVAKTTVCASSLNGSPGNRSSGDWGFDISNDARYVVFESGAGNLIPNDSTGGNEILLYDVLAKTLELVSLDDSGAKAGAYVYEPTVDSTGNRVAFRWKEGVYVRDRAAQRTFLVSPGTTAARFPDISRYSPRFLLTRRQRRHSRRFEQRRLHERGWSICRVHVGCGESCGRRHQR